MTTPSLPRAAALALAASTSLIAGCGAGDPRSCTVLCSSEGACPDGTSCGGDGYCYGPGETVGSCAAGGGADSSVVDEPDASLVDASLEDASREDSSMSEPDAADEPDADVDPCSGADSFGQAELGPFAIPDNDPLGIGVGILADAPGVAVETVEVRVDITHTFRGDITLDLMAPDGEIARLLNASEDPDDDIHQVFALVIAPGQAAGGEWVLFVADTGPADVGTLDRWSIGINCAAP